MDLERPHGNMDVETRLDMPESRRVQDPLLVRNIPLMCEKIPPTRKPKDEAGVGPSDVKTLDDLKRIPVYGQPEMRALIAEVGFDPWAAPAALERSHKKTHINERRQEK